MKKRRERENEQQKISENRGLYNDCHNANLNIGIRIIILLIKAAITTLVIAIFIWIIFLRMILYHNRYNW